MPSSTSNSSIVSSYIVPCCCFFASIIATLFTVWSLDRLSVWSQLDIDPAIYTKWETPKHETIPLFYTQPQIETGTFYKRRASHQTATGNIRKLGAEAQGYSEHPYNNLPEIEVKYGKYGFREGAFSPGADIALIGSSYAEAGFAKDSETWVGWLEKEHQLKVNNFGVSGVGGFTFLHYLERYVLPTKPKHVVWIFAERADWDKLVQEEQQIQNYREKKPFLPNFGQYLFGTTLFMLVNPIERLVQVYTKNSGTTPSSQKIISEFGQIGVGGKSYRVELNSPPTDLEFKESRRLLPKLLEKMKSLCRESNASFSILYIPSRKRLLSKRLGYPPETITTLDAYFHSLQAMANQQQIPLLDTTPKLQAALDKGVMVLNTIYDQHLNEVGMKIASRELAKLVENSRN